ncbi:MAG: hypothetical protein HONBIEJF_01651 [Fimbriimonadaceae bacterium]|nr:hypothetical protein [Fimbriimonadaceae bacterium]
MLTTILCAVLARPPATVSGTVTDGKNPVSEAAVWLEGPVEWKPMKGKIDQKNKRFEPHLLIVTTGSKVDFPNSDAIYHNVFAEYNAKKFDLGMYPRGQSKQVEFDKPGLVSVLCNVHSEMSAYIVVVDSPYFAKTDKKGQFKIAGVAPNDYTLKVWHESNRRASEPLKVVGDTERTVKIQR